MKYIRTYETREKFLTDKDSTSRGFRLKPTLYKYDSNGDHIHLEIDDPRKHEGSTYMEITLDSDVEFSFYIGNKSGDTQTTMNCSIDWGDGTVETKVITKDDKGFKLSHSYKAGSYKIELYGVERDYSVVGGDRESLISHSSNVKRVVLGEGVVNIGSWTFYKCTSLTSIFIPEGVTYIGSSVFSGCSSLTSIFIPEGVTYIGSSVFSGCSSLKSIHIPEGVTSIEAQTFNGCTSFTSVYIPEGVTSIGSNVFMNCSSLTSINLPSTLTSIGNWVFQNCSSLTSINLPSTLTSIGNWVFSDCTSLTSINLPSTLTSIGDYTFSYCSSLTSITIPEGVTSIGSSVFWNCSSLTSISSYNATAPTLGTKNVFTSMPTNGTLHIKPGATGYDAWLSALPSGWTIVEDL